MDNRTRDDYYEEPNSSHGEFVPNNNMASSGRPHEYGKAIAGSDIVVQHGVVIDLPLCNLKDRRVISLKECYLVLFEKFLTYKIVGKYETLIKDESTELERWEPSKANYRWTRMRSDFVEVSMYYDNPEKLWGVTLDFSGISGPTTFFFETGNDCKKLHDVLQNYLVTKNNASPTLTSREQTK